MRDYLKLLTCEIIKIRRTFAFWMIIIGPGLVALLTLMIFSRIEIASEVPVNIFERISRNAYSIWAFLMLPLLIALQTTLTGHIEYKNPNWKYLFSLPVKRFKIYLAKLSFNLLVMLAATIVLQLLLALCCVIIVLMRSDANLFIGSPPMEFFLIPFQAFLFSLLIIVLHSWISMRFSTVILGLATGVMGVTGTLVIANSDYIHYYPWSLPVFITSVSSGSVEMLQKIPVDFFVFTGIYLLIVIVISVITCRDIIRMDVS